MARAPQQALCPGGGSVAVLQGTLHHTCPIPHARSWHSPASSLQWHPLFPEHAAVPCVAYQALRDLTPDLPTPRAPGPAPFPQPRALFGDLQTSPVLVLSCAWKALPSHTNHFPLVNSYPSTFCWGHLLQGVFALPDLNIQSLSHPPIPVSLSSVGLFVWVSICPSPTLLSDLLED